MSNPREILDNYRANIIKEMLEARGEETMIRKMDNLDMLAAIIDDEAHIRQALDQLNEQEQLLIAHLLQRNGRMGYKRLRRTLLAAHEEQFAETSLSKNRMTVDGKTQLIPNANPRYDNTPSIEDTLAGLALKGLVLSAQPLDDNKTVLDWLHGRIIFIPEFVRQHIDPAALPDLPEPNSTAPPHVVSGSAQRFQRNLSRFARFLRRRGQLDFTTQGQLYKADLRELADEVSFVVETGPGKKEVDNSRLYFMRRLLPKVGLSEPQQYTVTSPLIATENPHLLRLPLTERVKQCFQAWRNEGVWHELYQLPTYSGGINLDYHPPKEYVRVRNVVLEHISAQPGEWVALEDLVDDIREEDYSFLFSQRTFRGSYNYYRREYETETVYVARNNLYSASFEGVEDAASGWDLVEAELINHIIAGPLFWLGLVDLGYAKEPPVDLQGNKPIVSFRLTPYGRWLIKGESEPETAPSAEGNLIIQPNFEIVTMGPVGDETLMTLDIFARSKQEQEHVNTFVLERDTVYQAQKSGWPIPRIIDYLEQLTSRPLPQNVRRSLEEWGALHERIVIRKNIKLLEAADEATAAQVEQDLADSQLRRVMDTVFLSNQPADQLVKQLDAARWIPLRTRAKNTTAPNSIRLDAEGNIEFTQPTPSIFARHMLRNISAETDSGRKLTRPLVNALVSEDGLDRLIMQLQQLSKGQLPPKLITKLKSWVGYYGSARTATVTLIEFASEPIRDELVHDEELRDYLTIFPAPGRALATVHPEFVDEVKAVLREREIEIGEGLP